MLFAAALLAGQAAPSAGPKPQEFEVASIRVYPQPWRVLHEFSAAGSRLTLQGYELRDLIIEAYNLKNYQLRFATAPPGPSDQPTFYNIAAKASGDAAPT